jgi:hypothetical protein
MGNHMLNITISIGDVHTEMTTDNNLSFDAIESLLNRAVTATLHSYLSLPEKELEKAIGKSTGLSSRM